MKLFLGSVVASCLLLSSYVQAQTDSISTAQAPLNLGQSKVVEVSRSFDPRINDAGKMSFLPKLDDTTVVVPKFAYHLAARPLIRLLPLRPIPAAKMARERTEKLRPFYAKLGFGNNTSPLAEMSLSGGRSEKYSYALGVQHLSSWGKLKLRNNITISAPQSSTTLEAHLHNVFRPQRIATHLQGVYHHAYSSFYGVGDTILRTLDTLWSAKQNRHHGGAYFNLGSIYLDSTHFQYQLHARLLGYKDNHGGSELATGASFDGQKNFKGVCYGGTLAADHYALTLQNRKLPNSVFSVAPWVKLYGERWRVLAGANLLYDNNGEQNGFHIYPKGHVSYDIIRQYFIPYFELDGGLDVADRWTLAQTIPYLNPSQKVWNSSRNMEIRGGLKGRFTHRLRFHLLGEYALIDSMRFAVNTPGYTIRNGIPDTGFLAPLHVIYDRAARTRAHAELLYTIDSRSVAGATLNYWIYDLQHLNRPWHTPTWEAILFANYNLRDKIYAGIDFGVRGGRWAETPSEKAIELPIEFDLNLQLRYSLGKHWALFGDFRNLLFQRFETYYGYPQHRFQAYLGLILQY